MNLSAERIESLLPPSSEREVMYLRVCRAMSERKFWFTFRNVVAQVVVILDATEELLQPNLAKLGGALWELCIIPDVELRRFKTVIAKNQIGMREKLPTILHRAALQAKAGFRDIIMEVLDHEFKPVLLQQKDETRENSVEDFKFENYDRLLIEIIHKHESGDNERKAALILFRRYLETSGIDFCNKKLKALYGVNLEKNNPRLRPSGQQDEIGVDGLTAFEVEQDLRRFYEKHDPVLLRKLTELVQWCMEYGLLEQQAFA